MVRSVVIAALSALQRSAVVLALAGAFLALPGPAQGHGVCRCTSPTVAAPGQTIETGRAFRVVWNPAERDFLGQQIPADVARRLRADEPPVRVLDRQLARSAWRPKIRVPVDAQPGTHVVLIYDGGDGGRHVAWDFVEVRGAGGSDSGGGGSPLLVAGGVLFAAALGFALWRRSAATPAA